MKDFGSEEHLDKLFPIRVELRKACEEAGGFCGAQHEGYGCTLPKNHELLVHVAHGALGEIVHKW